jgi:hypothetical protein
MRYITIPEPFVVVDALTGRPIEPVTFVSFAEYVRVALASEVQKNNIDTMLAIDIRELVDPTQAGAVLSISDEYWSALVQATKRISGWGVPHVLSAGPHLKAIHGAPTKKTEDTSSRSHETSS